MKKIIRITLLVLLVAVCLACVSCGGLSGLVSSREGQVTGTNYKISVDLKGGTGVDAKDFVSDTKLIEPATQPTRAGYVFAGWYADSEGTEKMKFNVVIKSDVTIYAKWNEKIPEATFVFGGDLSSEKVEAVGGKFTAPIKNRDGYELEGWYLDSDKTQAADFSAKAVDGTTFYAKWTPITYTITYDFGGLGNAAAQNVTSYTIEDVVTLLAPVNVTDGYEFLYWADEAGARQNTSSRGNVGNKRYTAVYVSHNNVIESVTGGSVIGDVVKIGFKNNISTINLYSIITVSDRARLAVYDDNILLDSTRAYALGVGTKEYTARVISEGDDVRVYTLRVTRYAEGTAVMTYHFPNGTTDTSSFALGSTGESIDPIDIVGYEFDEWYAEIGYENVYDFAAPIEGDVDVYAKYDAIQYTITYVYGVGNAPENQVVEYTIENVATVLAPVTPADYVFDGYTDDEEKTNFLTDNKLAEGAYGDVTLRAHYLRVGTTPWSAEFTTDQSLTKSQLVDYFNWAIEHRYQEVIFTVTDGLTVDELLGKEEPSTPSILSQSTALVSSVSSSYSYTKDEGGNITSPVTVTFTYVEPSKSAANSNAYTQLGNHVHGAYTIVRSNTFDDFAINTIDSTVVVNNSDQLVSAASYGYRPIPVENSPAEIMYNAAKTLLRTIVDDSMTDLQKAHAIFDWLVFNVTYDKVLFETSGEVVGLKQNKGFYLEGVFDDRRAVCDGISKAFALLCNIEGIPCVQVSGYALPSGGGHAWNKVYIDGHWYVVDPTHGDNHVDSYEAINHGYFLITDTERAQTAVPEDRADLVADTNYDIFADLKFTVDEQQYDFVIDSRAELHAVCVYIANVVREYGIKQAIEMRMNYAYENIGDELYEAMTGSGNTRYNFAGGAARGDVLTIMILD